MNKFINKFFNIMLILLITFLVLNQYYVIQFSNNLRNVFIFLTLILTLLTSIREVTLGKSGFSKFIGIVILFCIIIGGLFAVVNSKLNIFIYICLLFTLFQCFIELIYNKA